jgi:hypothetical protein
MTQPLPCSVSGGYWWPTGRNRSTHHPGCPRNGCADRTGAQQCRPGSLACQLADQTVEIGPAPASKSYLDIHAVLLQPAHMPWMQYTPVMAFWPKMPTLPGRWKPPA